ncbi:MAG: dienelactone hydrolase [Bacteroidetes bacterium HGW-Bacteroidetes-12]|nr:MAG: dienelactone hydrolase [Bacteroidetes bacterium HGW-Bacteroidetes-12]
MKKISYLSFATIASALLFSCGENLQEQTTTIEEIPTINVESEVLTYQSDTTKHVGYLCYDHNVKGKKPGILLVHEWWGLNDYAKMRAEKLAELGYVVLAVDMFGNGLTADNPQDAQKISGVIYGNPSLLKQRMQAAYDALQSNQEVDKENISALGYCFGGTVSLNAANMGIPFKTVVSFHGGLGGFKATEEMAKSKTLVLHGAADAFVPETDVANFKHQMDSVNAPYNFIAYENSTHAFTNKKSDETGKKFDMPIAYNEQADTTSWNDMKLFFEANFPAKR